MIEAFNRLNKAMNNLANTIDEFNETIKESKKAVDNTLNTADPVIVDAVPATEEQTSTEKKKAPRKKRVSKKQKEAEAAKAAEETADLPPELKVNEVQVASAEEQIPDDPSMAAIPKADNEKPKVSQKKIADFTKVRKVVQELIAQCGDSDSVKRLLVEDFGVEKLSAMDPSNYDEFVAKVKALAEADKILDNTIPDGLM